MKPFSRVLNGRLPASGNWHLWQSLTPWRLMGAPYPGATLHNLTFIRELELVPGCHILVSKRNMIIPHVEENLDRGHYRDAAPAICPCCGAPAKRETNTMPQWAGSSWYFLRYVDNKNDKELVSREKADKYLPVDMYIGGVEHAVLHLLYSRFYTKFLCDIGVIDFDEPFKKLFNQGMITGKNGIKMSKSKGNVVSPDDLVRDYGCDSLRLYELFVGPPELDAEWDDRGIEGVSRFLNRFYNLVMTSKGQKTSKRPRKLVKLRHKLVFDIEQRFEQFSLNTVISGFMEYNNKLIDLAKKEGGIDKETPQDLHYPAGTVRTASGRRAVAGARRHRQCLPCFLAGVRRREDEG